MSDKVDVQRWHNQIRPSTPASCSEIVRLKAPATSLTGMESTIVVSKLGIATAGFIKFTLKGFSYVKLLNAFSGRNKIMPAKWLGMAICESMRLSTHSRELSKYTTRKMIDIIERLPVAERNAIRIAGGYYLSADLEAMSPAAGTVPPLSGNAAGDVLDAFGDVLRISAANTNAPTEKSISVYIPILFSAFLNNTKLACWASFVESLQLSVKTRTLNKFWQTYGTCVAPTGFDIEAIVKYHVLSASHYSKALQANFKIGQSLNQMWEKSVLIASAYNVAPQGGNFDPQNPGKLQTWTLTSTATEFIRSVSVFVFYSEKGAYNAAQDIGNQSFMFDPQLEPIVKCRFTGGGRTLFDLSKTEADLFLAGMNKGIYITNSSAKSALGYNNNAVHSVESEGNAFHYSWAESSQSSHFSGGLALSGISSQEWYVESLNFGCRKDTGLAAAEGAIVPTASEADRTLNIEIWANCVDIKSISSSDGRYLNSLSV